MLAEDLKGYKYKGEDFLYLVEIEDELGQGTLIRPFDQTGGSTSMSADEMEISTKDRSGADYGDTTQTVSLEGQIVFDDPFIKAMKKAIRNKKFVKIYEVDTKTLEAEYGMYMVSTFDREFSHGDFATYSLEGTLFGEVCETTLTEIPDGAPAIEGMDCDGNEGNDGGGAVEG